MKRFLCFLWCEEGVVLESGGSFINDIPCCGHKQSDDIVLCHIFL